MDVLMVVGLRGCVGRMMRGCDGGSFEGMC